MGIRGDSVLAPWRPLKTIAAEEVINAAGAVAAPPNCPPLVMPLRPGPLLLVLAAPAPPLLSTASAANRGDRL